MKYIIMECHSSYAVLLDEKGRFWKAANLRYQIGQTVEDPVLMKEPGMGKKIKQRAVMGIAAAAACFLLAFTGYYRDYMVRDASICLTINPSVRMELNRKGQVMAVAGVNEDGRKLLEGYRQGSRDRLAVTEELIERAIEAGYLSAGGKIVLDIDAPEEAVFQKYGVELRMGLTEYLTDTLEVEIEIIRHNPAAKKVQELPEEEMPLPSPPEMEVEIRMEEESPEVSMPKEEAESPGNSPETAAPETDTKQPRQDMVQQETPVHDGDSEYDGNTDYGSGSGHEEDSGYGSGSGHEEDSGYGGSSDYEEGSDYGSGSDYEGHSDSHSDYE